jgi:hypothetical protein
VADLSDVLHGLRDTIAGILYPNGAPSGTAPQSIAGCPVRVVVGWVDASLDADLKAGVAWVTLWPRPGMARSVGPYLTGWRELPRSAPSLTVSVASEVATFAGTGTNPDMIAAVIVDGAAAYTYPLHAGNGPADVAAALAALIAVDRTATASGAALTVPGASLVARVVSGGTERREIRRLQQSIQIDVWAPAPALRDTLARAIDEALIEDFRTLDMPDGTKATISYEGTGFDEEGRAQPLHRRFIAVSVEYSSVRTRTAPPIAVPTTEITPEPARITRTVLS